MDSPIKNSTVAYRAWYQLTDRIMTVCWTMMHPDEALPFGKIQDMGGLFGRKWDISKERGKETGSAFFRIESEKYTGIARIVWERYPNGQRFAQVIEDADGFELYNRSPSIVPPEIEITPGAYAWHLGRHRGNVLTITERELSIACVDRGGFITWERTGRYQMVGRKLHMVDILERNREPGKRGYVFTEWQQAPDTVHPVKKNSETEFELLLAGGRRPFTRARLVRSAKGYAYSNGQRMPGRVVPPKGWKS